MILEAIATFFATKNFTYQHYEYVILEATATFFATKNFTHQFYEYVILEATATFFATKIFIFMILEAIATFFATKNFAHQHYELTHFIYLTHQETIEKWMPFCLFFQSACLFFEFVVLEKCAFDFSNPVPTAYYNFLEPFWI